MKSSLTSEGPAPLLRAFVLAAITLYPIWFTIHYRAVYDPDKASPGFSTAGSSMLWSRRYIEFSACLVPSFCTQSLWS